MPVHLTLSSAAYPAHPRNSHHPNPKSFFSTTLLVVRLSACLPDSSLLLLSLSFFTPSLPLTLILLTSRFLFLPPSPSPRLSLALFFSP